uniref:Hedgehog/Intein (Hint) domain-containing protein n=1 Tax=viral metagenome TaxID=1070528 RepID=A0A6C0JX77_9ZZZZ
MLSVYVPFVSTGTNTNPRACVGDSLYEWVINNAAVNTLTRIRKDTYALTNTVSLPNTNCTHITSGIYQGNNYIFTSSGATAGNIYRINSIVDNPASTLTTITLTKTDTSTNICASSIVYRNGYLWLIPSNNAIGISGTIIRLDIFNNFSKLNYAYTSSSTDSQVTVYTGILSLTSNNPVFITYIFGDYIFNIGSGNTATVITKMSTAIPGTSGIISSPSNCTFTYTTMYINSIASDNINYIWMSESSSSSGTIFRMDMNYNLSITEYTPTSRVTPFSSTIVSITTMKYGSGYLWIAGKTISGGSPVLVQFDVNTYTVMNTISLISTPSLSQLTSIDIYNEYMWMTDNVNSALLKMKIYVPCFREGTKLLCLNAQMKEEYIPIENIRKGHLVKTSLNGFVPVCMIGKSSISNPGGNDRIKNRLYKCSKDKYPELFEDLYITGCHSILVNHLSDSQRENTMDALGDIFITDRKYRLMAYLDDRSEPYIEPGKYTIWHLALEHSNYFMNYGIYANGLLVESTSKRYMKELSGMKLIE